MNPGGAIVVVLGVVLVWIGWAGSTSGVFNMIFGRPTPLQASVTAPPPPSKTGALKPGTVPTTSAPSPNGAPVAQWA